MLVEVFLSFLALYLAWRTLKKPDNLPPGPWGLPFVGFLPVWSKTRMEDRLTALNKKHGDVVSWRFGSKLIVVVFDFKLFKTAFSSMDFVDRADLRIFSALMSHEGTGIVSGNGIPWVNGRRFGLRHLRDLGMGKSRFLSTIQLEATLLVKELKKTAGKSGPVPHCLHVSVVNVIWQMVANKRYEMHDKELVQFENMVKEVEGNLGIMTVQDFFPWLNYVVPKFLLDKLTKEDCRKVLSDTMTSFHRKYIDEHRATLDPNNVRDFIDAYLVEMDNQREDSTSTMSISDLTAVISDFFGAGSETMGTILKWAIFYLANNPRIQKRLQAEIDDVLPDGAPASLEDKPRLPYTEAFTHELLRYSNMTKFVGIHMAIKDTTLGGYDIPKGTYVCGAMYQFHFDPKFFEDPNEFRPERFLDSEGKFVSPKDGFGPFGTGRRQCLGESLARMELFVFLTSLVQTFTFAPPPPATKINTEPLDIPFMNIVRPEAVLMTIR